MRTHRYSIWKLVIYFAIPFSWSTGATIRNHKTWRQCWLNGGVLPREAKADGQMDKGTYGQLYSWWVGWLDGRMAGWSNARMVGHGQQTMNLAAHLSFVHVAGSF